MRSSRFRPCLIALTILFLVVTSFSLSIALESWSGKVVAVRDGDTIEIMRGGRVVLIRLAEIDCPEMDQPFGKQAKKFASHLSLGEIVKVLPTDTDKYGRMVAKIILPDGRSLNQEMIKAGLAWWNTRYSNDDYLKHLEKEARENKRGLWSDPRPIPPWVWKHSGQRKL
jgi:micrococcal nuclease